MRNFIFAALLSLSCAHPKPVAKAPSAPPSSAPVEAAPDPTSALPSFTLKTLEEQPMSSESLHGKVVLINFWASYCGPCKDEFPALEMLHKTYQSDGLVVLGVSIDDTPAASKQVAAQYGLSFPNVYGGESLYRQLGGKGTPFSILVERSQITAKISGRRSEDFFEGLVWSALSLDPKSRIGSIRPQEKKKTPVVVEPPKPIAKEANGWKLESANNYGGNLGTVYGVKRGDGDRAFVGAWGKIFYSDGDGSWKTAHDDPDGQWIHGLWALSAKEIYAVGENSPILYSSDSGATWAPISERLDLDAIWGSGPNDIYVTGDKGLILHSSDKGKTWQKQESNVKLSLLSIWGSGANDIYIGATFGILLHSTDRGKTWDKIDTKHDGAFESIWGSSADDVYVVGGKSSGVILHSTDRGKTWSAQEKGKYYIGSVLGFSRDDVWISGEEVYRSRDRGKTWEVVPTIPNAPIIFLWGSSPTNMYTAGPRGTILHKQ